MNLGGIQRSRQPWPGACLHSQITRLKPDLDASSTWACYIDLGNLDQALASTLKSLELKPDNPDALVNLGIYKDLGNLDQALASTLKSLELKPDNQMPHEPGRHLQNLDNLDQLLFTPSNP